MYKLSIEFKTIEDLASFVQKNSGSVIGSVVEKAAEITEVEAQPIPVEKKEKKTKAKKNDHAEVMEEVPSPFAQAQVQASVRQAVQAPVQQAPAFDRAGAIAKATELVNKLKSTGLPDDQIMPNVHMVFDQVGCDRSLRISQLDDSSLSKFLPAFEHMVNTKFAQASAPQQPTASFI